MGFMGILFFYVQLDVSAWLFGHLLFWVSYMHVFCIFVFAAVQRNWACFTWKGALEICSLLLLLLLLSSLLLCVDSTIHIHVFVGLAYLHLSMYIYIYICRPGTYKHELSLNRKIRFPQTFGGRPMLPPLLCKSSFPQNTSKVWRFFCWFYLTSTVNTQTIHVHHTYTACLQSSPLHNQQSPKFDPLYKGMVAQILAFL